MKRSIAFLMALAMLCSAACFAEETPDMDKQAKDLISMVNYFTKENTGIEQLFIGYQAVVPGEIYGFYTEENAIQALIVADVEENVISSCSFICDDPNLMQLALNCASIMPFAQLLMGDDESTAEPLQDDMIAMANWIDENSPDALECFENAAVYTNSYLESEYFKLDLMIVPLDEGARMMASYYFHPQFEESAD